MARSRSRKCPACGQPLAPTTAEQSERFYKSILRVFSGDPVAHGVVVDGFTVMQRPESKGGGGCANALEAFLGMAREVVGTYGIAGRENNA